MNPTDARRTPCGHEQEKHRHAGLHQPREPLPTDHPLNHRNRPWLRRLPQCPKAVS